MAGEELGRITAVQHKNADGLSRGPSSNILSGEECDEEAALSPERVIRLNRDIYYTVINAT